MTSKINTHFNICSLSFCCRYNAEQVALSSYGDSEAESEEDEEEEDAEVGAALHHAEEDEDDFDSGIALVHAC